MKFTFYPSFREKDIDNAVIMTGIEIKNRLSAYVEFPVNLLSITIDDKVLEDRATPASIGMTEKSIGFCFIAIPEPDMGVKPIQGNTKSQIGVTTLSTRGSYSKPATARVVAPRPITDNEYARQEIETGKYTRALREVRDLPILKPYFLKELKSADAKLFRIFSNQDGLLQRYINESGALRLGEAAITIIRDDDRENIQQLTNMMGIHNTSQMTELYLRNNRNMEAAANELLGY